MTDRCDALADRELFDTEIGKVCMSRAEFEAYEEEKEKRKIRQSEAQNAGGASEDTSKGR